MSRSFWQISGAPSNAQPTVDTWAARQSEGNRQIIRHRQAEYARVEVLLAPEVYQYRRQGRGRTPPRSPAPLVRLARAVLGSSEPG
jgi:hypothetical protein